MDCFTHSQRKIAIVAHILMFDTEAIDNVDRYEIIRQNKDMFTTLYGEKSIYG